MRYLVIILTLASLLALMACGDTSIMPVDSPDTTGSSSRDMGSDTAGDGAESTDSSPDMGSDTAGDGAESTDSSPDMGSDTAGDRAESTDSNRDTRTDTAGDGAESADSTTDSTADNEMSKKAPSLGIVQPDTTLKTESASPAALMGQPASPSKGSDRHQRIRPTLKAGEVDDNKLWDEYLDFVEEYRGPTAHETNLSNRHIITILDQAGRPVPNAKVTISMKDDGADTTWTNRTYADGRTMFFPEGKYRPSMAMQNGEAQHGQFTITAKLDGFTSILHIPQSAQNAQQRNHEITLEGTMHFGGNIPLDVLFLLDSTGSMADEIHQIKSTLHSTAKQVSNLPSNPNLKFGMVSYRDRGDEYVTRLYQFDSNVKRFSWSVDEVQANGGHDYPESLNQALHESVNDMNWRSGAIRLIFLIADAPPHLDYPQDEDYAAEMVKAREKGIKVFSVASSGLDQQGEYIFRQIAQQTMGRFIFILEEGPQGNLETPHSVEQYSVNQLDSLIIRLIREELEATGHGRENQQ